MKNIFKICFVSLSLFMSYSCEEDEDRLKPYGADKSIPAQVSNVTVENISGGALFTFDLPDDPNILSIKAVYTSTSGEEKSATVSAYADSLIIKGIGNTEEYPVKLYSVSYANVYSVPLDIMIKPLTPPIELVFNSLEPQVDFGGFTLEFENKEKAEIAIYILQQDSITGEMVYHDALYTGMSSGVYNVRDLANKETNFAVYIRDRFDNMSDTLLFTETPWREDYLNKELISFISGIGDNNWTAYEAKLEYLFDDIVSSRNFVHTPYPVEFPHGLTIDLGVNVKLNRFKLWQRLSEDIIFQHGSPKYFKIYGRMDRPEEPNLENEGQDPLEGWELLSECNSIKPSGLPVGQYSSEDWEYAAKGEEYSFNRDIQPVRYLRFVMLESWSGMKCSLMSELSFWGEIQGNE